ncbi:MAG: hypothetical protein HQL54_03420 [Magnetococcales bacterium]|nr:hypothetical protein [Magnetococcales bacterium]
MTRLSKIEIQKLESKLSTWFQPKDMLTCFRQISNDIGSEVFFNQAGLAFLRDAYIGAKFGKIRNANKVRLITENQPDFEIIINKTTMKFEATEVLRKGRRRGSEYQPKCTGEVVFCSPDELEVDEEQILQSIKDAINNKNKRYYPPDTHLIAYVNIPFIMWYDRDSILTRLKKYTQSQCIQFQSVWILWNDRVDKL